MHADDVRALLAKLTPQHRLDARQLAQELVRQEKLTWYQAAQLCQGKTTGLVLGNYVLLDQIGAGGMGQVYRARHRRLDRIVALKVLSPAIVQKPAAVQRFQREAKAVAKLSHANIVAAHDADEAQGTHFLVMEYVDGTDLAKLVKKQGPLPVNQAVDCIVQAARGLAHAHAAGIVHRDIKPHNLLLAKAQGSQSVGLVKVLDLGLVRFEQANADTVPDDLTGTGNIMGTADYMAPEQAVNPRLADHRADIYSLGCTLFFLLTGKPMFRGETSVEKLMAHQNEPIPSLRAARPEVSEALEAVHVRMAAKKPEQRYQSMAEVLNALQAFSQIKVAVPLLTPVAGPLPLAQPIAPDYRRSLADVSKKFLAIGTRVRQWSKRWPMAAGAAGTLLLLLAIWAVFFRRSALVVEHQSHWVEKEWIKATAQLSGLRQAEAVRAKLTQRNPGFDGKETYEINEGKVEGLDLNVSAITDLSPLRGLPELKRLTLSGKHPKNFTPDLAPLQGLQLTALDCSSTLVADLTPLRGMPLTGLNCHDTRVANLRPLQGMPLVSLSAGSTAVTDLSPLKGLPLKYLAIGSTRVSDLSPLVGIQLIHLGIGYSNVADLTPLKGMPLTRLDCRRSQVSDHSPLKGLPLKELSCDFDVKRDADILRSIATLQNINGKSAAVFWQEMDAQLPKK